MPETSSDSSDDEVELKKLKEAAVGKEFLLNNFWAIKRHYTALWDNLRQNLECRVIVTLRKRTHEKILNNFVQILMADN